MLPGILTDRMIQVRFFRFLVVGGIVAVVQFAVLAVARNYWSAGTAFTAGFGLATLTHYILNKIWALPSSRNDIVRQSGEYLLTAMVSYIINLAVFTVAHSVFGLSVMWAAVSAVPPATLVVFLLLHYIVFRARA